VRGLAVLRSVALGDRLARQAILGICVTLAGCLAWAFVPEAVRWLAGKGRFAEARAEVARQLGVPLPT
jgi:hypothetical protein